MTNKDKYLKDGVDVGEFWNDFIDYIDEHSLGFNANNFETFLNDNVKPTLTEDEKVILRNMNEDYKHLKRANNGDLYAGVDYFGAYSHLFQFIKPRRRI